MARLKEIFAMLLLLVAVGCSDYTEEFEKERDSIVKFLTSSHDPRLIEESEVSESLELDPEFYSMVSQGVFRYIADYYNPAREELSEIKSGDEITITFWCYDFSSYSQLSKCPLFYTNDVNYKAALEEAGLNTEYWSFEPKTITLGAGDILSAVDRALEGCKEGDLVELYITSNMVYGKEWIGVTAQDMPMAFVCTIDSVEN